jgi:two-component system, NarL family, sensor kinase
MSGADQEGLERLIAAEQDERRRLALFLHDGPVQQLSGIALMLDGALHSIGRSDDERARGIIGAALEQQRATIRELRDLSFALEPVVLRDHGFGPALRALADQTASSRGIEIEVDVERATELGATASVALYTIVRELVDQAVRRGPPPRIRITVASDELGLVASVVDDGEPERRRTPIEAIEERVRPLHGTVQVLAADSGTEVRVTLPAHTARR